MSIFTPILGKPIPEPIPGVRQIFTDGGVAGKNPSPIGGSWAWCEVEGGKRIRSDSGVLSHKSDVNVDMCVSNNATELLAIINALTAALCNPPFKKPTRIQLHTDSVCAAKWALGNGSTENVPHYLLHRLQYIRRQITDGQIEVGLSLMGGHPNPADLKRGWRVQPGKSALPVSKWNVWCDEECRRLANEMTGRTPRKPNPNGAAVTKNGLPLLPKKPVISAPLTARIIDVPALASASAQAVQMDMFAGEGAGS